MNAVRFGLSIRALRRRKGWRQLDLARRAGTSQQTVSRMERGDAETATLASIHRVAAALEAQIDLAVRWRGGLLDRVLDERHARLVGSIAGRLATWGFDVVPEVSYAEYGERGSIDLLAVDRGSRLLVVVEAKTELTSIEATLRKHDEKVRLAPVVAQRRLGLGGPWRAIPVLVLPESGGARRRLAAHASVLDRAYPLRGRELTTRLRARRGLDRLGGVLLLPVTRDMGVGRAAATPHRVPRSR